MEHNLFNSDFRINSGNNSRQQHERMNEINDRLLRINGEMEADGADLDALLQETKDLTTERGALREAENQRQKALEAVANGTKGKKAYSFPPNGEIRNHYAERMGQYTHEDFTDKIIFRSGESISAKYTADVDADKCLRAAITGNYNDLNEAERRALTPENGGAMLAPEISSRIIDNLRKSDWMEIFRPSVVMMNSGEVKIPIIEELPTAIMHTPGTEQTPNAPIIEAATLNAKTMMVLVEVANELLQDASTSRGIIIQACSNAINNKLLQQVLYGTGIAPEMKGIATYEPNSFADAGEQADEVDLYRLVTMARMAIIKSNGYLDAMLYDCDLEDRLNKRLATGELVQPSRAFSELYAAGRVLPHPSVAAGDMFFMQSDALYIGFREHMRVEVDPFSSFNSNNTKFRLILRADIYANAAKMVYYSDIPPIEPTT